MALTLEQIEARLRALEERNRELGRQLGIGSRVNDNVLALATDLIDLGEVPSCGIHKTGDQTLSNTILTEIAFGTTTWDTDQMADLSNNGITIRRSGLYLVTLNCLFAADSTGYRNSLVEVDDTVRFMGQTIPAHATIDGRLSSANIRYLTLGETLTASVRQASGGDLALRGSTSIEYGPQLTATLISDTGSVRTEMA